MKRSSFVFYDSFYLGIKDLPDGDRLSLYDAVVKYAIEGNNPPPLNSLQNAIFSLIKPQLDANNKKYKNGKLGKGFGKLGGEYGKLGGRPKTPQKPPTKPPKNPPNVNVNVNVNENENEIKNKLSPLDEKELLSVCAKLKLDYQTVSFKHDTIMEKVEDGDKKIKSVKMTLLQWLRRDITLGYIQPIEGVELEIHQMLNDPKLQKAFEVTSLEMEK